MSGEPIDLFKTRDHVADFDRYLLEYAQRSEQTRASLSSRLAVRYGDGTAETLDLFFPTDLKSPAPVHLFIHGGYWRMFSKDDFSFVADTVVAAGGIAAIMDYDLMPSVRMGTIIDQVRCAAAWLVTNAASFGGDAKRLSVSGHSAGAHLACALLETDSPVTPNGALLLSGIYDMAPLQNSFLQPLIGLTDDEARNFSPLTKAYRVGTQVSLLVGEHETLPFHTQADAMRSRFAAHFLATGRADIAGANHMSIALDLGDTATEVGSALAEMVAQL